MIKVVTDPDTSEVDRRSELYYDRIAKNPKRYRPGRPIPGASLALFCNMLVGPKMLDVGCGSAWYVGTFLDFGFDYIGIDTSTGMLRLAQERFTDLDFRKMNCRALEFETASFDGIWFDHGLDVVPKKEVPVIFSEFHRVLKPYGALMLSTPVAPLSAEAWYYPNSLNFPEEFLYHALWQESEVSKALMKAGFSILAQFIEDRPAMTFLCRRNYDDLPL